MKKELLRFFSILGVLIGSSSLKAQDTHLQELYSKVPNSIRAFETMSFDQRFLYKEELTQRSGNSFYTLLENEVGKYGTETLELSETISIMGKPLRRNIDSSINLTNAIRTCGFDRLSSFIDFKEKNQQNEKGFLTDKTDTYKSALFAEYMVLSEASGLFEVDEWINFRRKINDEFWEYNKTHEHPITLRLYRQRLLERSRAN